MTRCRCIEEFEVQKVDENGFDTGECYFVEADSLWNLDRGAYCIYGQNRLEKLRHFRREPVVDRN